MLEHLLYTPDVSADPEPGFTPVERLDSGKLYDAKVGTADVFERLGAIDDDEISAVRSEEQAANAFTALIGMDEQARLKAVGAINLPSAVKSSVAMLTQYQWNFVAQAAELRSMAVSKIVAETDNPNAGIRLKALQMLGNVTEVALFTERVEVKKTVQDSSEIEALIREKLAKFAKIATTSEGVEDAEARVAALVAPAAQEIEDAVLTEPAPIAQGEA